jgi:hypothetical protein
MSDRKLDEVTLGVFGDHDAGYGLTYNELDFDDDSLNLVDDTFATECDLDFADFNFGDKAKRPKFK